MQNPKSTQCSESRSSVEDERGGDWSPGATSEKMLQVWRMQTATVETKSRLGRSLVNSESRKAKRSMCSQRRTWERAGAKAGTARGEPGEIHQHAAKGKGGKQNGCAQQATHGFLRLAGLKCLSVLAAADDRHVPALGLMRPLCSRWKMSPDFSFCFPIMRISKPEV